MNVGKIQREEEGRNIWALWCFLRQIEGNQLMGHLVVVSHTSFRLLMRTGSTVIPYWYPRTSELTKLISSWWVLTGLEPSFMDSGIWMLYPNLESVRSKALAGAPVAIANPVAAMVFQKCRLEEKVTSTASFSLLWLPSCVVSSLRLQSLLFVPPFADEIGSKKDLTTAGEQMNSSTNDDRDCICL